MTNNGAENEVGLAVMTAVAALLSFWWGWSCSDVVNFKECSRLLKYARWCVGDTTWVTSGYAN